MQANTIITSESELRRVLRSEIDAAAEKLSQPPTPPPKEWLTEREARDYLGWSKATMHRRRDDGTLPYSKIGSSLFYRREDLLDVLDQHRVAGLRNDAVKSSS